MRCESADGAEWSFSQFSDATSCAVDWVPPLFCGWPSFDRKSNRPKGKPSTNSSSLAAFEWPFELPKKTGSGGVLCTLFQTLYSRYIGSVCKRNPKSRLQPLRRVMRSLPSWLPIVLQWSRRPRLIWQWPTAMEWKKRTKRLRMWANEMMSPKMFWLDGAHRGNREVMENWQRRLCVCVCVFWWMGVRRGAKSLLFLFFWVAVFVAAESGKLFWPLGSRWQGRDPTVRMAHLELSLMMDDWP